MHERYRRQTDRRQTDGRQHIANVNVSSRSLKTVVRGVVTTEHALTTAHKLARKIIYSQCFFGNRKAPAGTHVTEDACLKLVFTNKKRRYAVSTRTGTEALIRINLLLIARCAGTCSLLLNQAVTLGLVIKLSTSTQQQLRWATVWPQ